MRANEFVVEGWVDTAKGLASGAGNALSGMMKSATDKDSDWLKGQMYRYGGGKFGQQGNIAATKSIFIKNFVQEYNQIAKSAKQSGMDVPSMQEYVGDYLEQTGWRANPAQLTKMLATSGDSIENVANGVYTIGMMNMRGAKDPSSSTNATPSNTQPADEPLSFAGKKLDPNDPADARMIQQVTAQQGRAAPTTTASGQEIDTAPTTDKIIKTVQNMTGTSYTDDLERIANTALQQLYGSNKSAYAAARKAIINPAQSSERIEPTMSESSRKIVKIATRHK